MTPKNTTEAFLPGDDIREELEARGWTQRDLAAILGIPANVVSDIITGRRSITSAIANLLSKAFGTSAQYWMNLQTAYDLASKELKRHDSVVRRAKLYDKAPIREMIRRRWIEDTNNIDFLEAQVCKFLEIDNIENDVNFAHAAKKSDDYNTKPNFIQTAWLMRVKMLAPSAPIKKKYNDSNFDYIIEELAPLRLEAEAISQVPGILAKYGVRLLIIEYLPQAKIDGACFWLDSQSPVMALSMRFDRIDNFWFNLVHELCHVKNREGIESPILETLVFGEDAQPFDEKPEQEKRADKFAAEFLVNQNKLQHFIERKQRLYSENDIRGFAKLNGIHPGIVVGQLHYRRAFHWKYFRGMLTKVKEYITDTALTDGWGKIIVK